MRHLRLFPALLLTALSLPPAAGAQTVARVIDADTYELSDGRRVRLIGVDSPEKYGSGKLSRDAARTGQDRATIQALGERASAYARRLVEGQGVELEYDPANTRDGHRDRYGRTLAYVWVIQDGRRGFMANAELIRAGYANVYTSYPFEWVDEFRALEREARELRRGLWADEGPAGTPEPSRPASLRYDPKGPDRDCADFRTQAEAQAFFEEAGMGDPHRLDRDRDGIACESLPGTALNASEAVVLRELVSVMLHKNAKP